MKLNYLSGRKFVQHVSLRATDADHVPEGGATTSLDRITREDRVVRKCFEMCSETFKVEENHFTF